MSFAAKHIDQIPDNFQGIYQPQQLYLETGLEKHRRRLSFTADELCCQGGNSEPDTTAPDVTSRTPFHDEGNVPLNAIPSLTFNEIIVFTNGLIEVRRSNDNVSIKGYFHDSPDIAYQNGSTTISFVNIPFAAGTAYYILIPNGAIVDQAGNPYQGYAALEWQFVTA